MNMRRIFAVVVFAIVGPQAVGGQEAHNTPPSAIVPGELRLFAIAPDQPAARDTLYRVGWVEADGRLFRQQEFPELYAQIGRAWTRSKVAKDMFAVPNLRDRRNEPNPYGVLGPGDLIHGGRPESAPAAPIYFIYVGKDAHSVEARWK